MSHGQAWTTYLQALSEKSRASYEREVEAFSTVLEQSNENLQTTLLNYLKTLREKGAASSTLQRIHSILNAFLKTTQDYTEAHSAPIWRQLKAWEKQATKKKASIFTEEDYNKYLDAPKEFLVDKIIFITALHGLLRLTEFHQLTVKSYTKIAPSIYQLNSNPQKQVGSKQQAVHFVTGHKEVSLLDTYLSLFEPNDNDRLFRKISWKKGKPKIINTNIGKNTLADTGKRIARFLQLEDPDTYTSHAFRRTAATKLADKGVSLPMLQKAGGWKSASVAQTYVGDSKASKLEVAEKLSASSSSSSASSSSSSSSGSLPQSISGGQIVNISYNAGAVVNYITNNYTEHKTVPIQLQSTPSTPAIPPSHLISSKHSRSTSCVSPLVPIPPLQESNEFNEQEKNLFEEQPPTTPKRRKQQH